MDNLWAPWRMAYIADAETDGQKQEKEQIAVLDGGDPDCFICQAAIDLEGDRKRHVLERTAGTITVLNKFPYNNGHLLVAPKRHVAKLDLLSKEERDALGERINHWIGKLEVALNPHGFNIGLNLGSAAGAGLPGHLHWHIVPRWNGDTNFMASLAATKVIPQSLETLWEILYGNNNQ